MTRLALGFSALIVLAAGGSWLFLAGDSEARPGRAARQKAAAADDLLPYANVAPPEVIERDYINMRVTPFDDPKFYFEVTVPRNFHDRPLQVTPQQLSEDSATPVPMVEFVRDADGSVLIEARYVRVPERVTLDRFMEVFVEQSGFQFVKRQRGVFEDRQVEDALLRADSPVFGKALTRITVSRRGDLVFMVAGSCRESEYARWKQVFAVAALSFRHTGK